jgi:hypothetical protein
VPIVGLRFWMTVAAVGRTSSVLKTVSALVTMPVVWPEHDRRRFAAASNQDNQEEPS